MIGAVKGKILSGGKKSFKNEAQEDIEYWRILIADPKSEYPMSLTVDTNLAEHIIGNEGTFKEYLNNDCMITLDITKYNGQFKLKVTDIQPAKA